MMRRRSLSTAFAALALSRPLELAASGHSLDSAEIELTGDWRASPPHSAARVVERMRNVCLAGVSLLSDRQPARIRVDSRNSGYPSIWLHFDSSPLAWIHVNIGERDWCKLAYQFGHELGHVLANSWGPDARPAPPCQWLEEVLVEAFSLRGLGKLADSWYQSPVFPNDVSFADAIRRYRRNAIMRYEEYAAGQMKDFRLDRWFRQYRSPLENYGGLSGPAEAAIPSMLRELEEEMRSIEDLGALNRWPGRSSVPIEQYLNFWKESCNEIGAAGRLPGRVRDLLGLA